MSALFRSSTKRSVSFGNVWFQKMFILWFLIVQANGSLTAEFPQAGSSSLLARDSNPHSNTTIIYDVNCVYQISGAYTLFQRILFYLVIAFTYSLRFHQWLTAAGMAFLLTFTGTAAIHAIALSFQTHVGHDTDQWVLGALIEIALYSCVVFYLHSPKIFETNTQHFILIWGSLLLFAHFTLLGRNGQFLKNLNGTFSYKVCTDGFCRDYCNSNPQRALFRSHDTLVPWNQFPVSNTTKVNSTSIVKSHTVPGSQPVLVMDPNRIAFFVVAGALLSVTSINMEYSPKAVRNAIVRHLTSQHIGLSANRSPFQYWVACTLLTLKYCWRVAVFFAFPLILIEFLCRWIFQMLFPSGSLSNYTFKGTQRRHFTTRPREIFATFVGLSWYFWSTLGYLLWPAMLFYNIVYSEQLLADLTFPESEAPDAVGQWSSWVVAAGTILAVLCARVFSEDNEEEKSSKEEGDETIPLYSNPPPRWLFGWHQGWYYVQLISLDWKDFKEWWSDPVGYSWSKAEGTEEGELEEQHELMKSGIDSTPGQTQLHDWPRTSFSSHRVHTV